MNIRASIVLDKRKAKKQTEDEDFPLFPIKLRLTRKKEQKYFSLPKSKTAGIEFDATEKDWEKINGRGARGRLHEIRLIIPEIIKEAEEIIRHMDPFTFDGFRERFYQEKTGGKDLFDYFSAYIGSLKKAGRVATAQSYQSAMNSLKDFDPKMDFAKVDKSYLDRYETWFLQKKKGKKASATSQTTVGIYTRNLRTIFNLARKDGVTEDYPFGAREYVPPTGRNIKKALELADVRKILEFKTVRKSPTDRARDLWVFSYFSNGMNFKDICSIREKDIQGDLETIEFVREKTKLSSRGGQKKVEVLIIPETKTIIEKWGEIKDDPENYVFPFFQKSFTPEQKRSTVLQLVKTTNKYLEKISREAGLPMTITTYHARHSFASILKESGASTEYISEALGHNSLQTTESYLKSFSRAHREKWAEALRGNRPAE